MKTQATGRFAEQLAVNYLKTQAYKVVEKNYHSPYGEIDIICSNNQCLAFIEVRYRRNALYGGAAASVTNSKQEKIVKTAEYFLSQKQFKKYLNMEMRFDVIAIEGERENNMQWIKSAFTL